MEDLTPYLIFALFLVILGLVLMAMVASYKSQYFGWRKRKEMHGTAKKIYFWGEQLRFNDRQRYYLWGALVVFLVVYLVLELNA